jgi:energy-coupling factor transporter ATP-binding protein EcfA2
MGASHVENQREVQRIEHLSVIGGFLDGLRITFREGLNTIIGARGTGKTTAVEFIGYALDSLPSREHAADERKRIETLVKRNLGGGRISVGIRAKDGARYNVTRAFGDEPIILDADDQPVSVNLKSGLFRAEIYSQNAVESIADRPLFQLDLIDSFAGQQMAETFSREQQIVSTLKANAHQIIPLEREVAAINDELAALPTIETKLKAFVGATDGASAEINEAHRLKSLRDRETRSLKQLRELVCQFQDSLRGQVDVVGPRAAKLVDPEMAKGPNADVLRRAVQLVVDCARDVDALLGKAVMRIEQAGSAVAEQAEVIAQRHREQELAFRTTIEKHKQAQQQAAERTELERRRNQLLARQHQQAEVRQHINELYQHRKELLDQLSELRDQRFSIRKTVADRINGELAPAIRVTIVQYGNADAYRQMLETRLKGAGIKQGIVAQKIATAMPPAELTAVIRNRDSAPLIDRAELNADQSAKVAACLADPEFLFTLETVELDDQPLIELKDGQEYKDTSSLSTGQKCTTILPILLLESDSTLIVDQPEDNLDNRFIFQTVVESIRHVKAKRQLVLVTHNPNIPVLGEADHVVVLESDGVRARVAKEGDVDDCKSEIVTLLEGGAEAFRRRGERYGQ